ncbi:hypothetical protein CRV24_002382 [Beauveria bassiana]|nr:hypothetical protein CRV24_002382 [Beauveria bassiana]
MICDCIHLLRAVLSNPELYIVLELRSSNTRFPITTTNRQKRPLPLQIVPEKARPSYATLPWNTNAIYHVCVVLWIHREAIRQGKTLNLRLPELAILEPFIV